MSKKVRLSLEKDGTLRTRDGQVVGTLASITLDLHVDLSGDGGLGGSSSSRENDQTSLLGSAPGGGVGEGETNADRSRRLLSQQIDDVLDHYVATMSPRGGRDKMGDEERRLVREALKVATALELKNAITGCTASAFHMGENDRRRKYNALSQIIKGKRGGRTTREQIDFFLDIAAKSGVKSGVTSADPARVRQAKRDVLDAYEFPGDENVVERGKGAAAWLAEQGFKIVYEESGRPSFRLEAEEG